MPAYKYTHTEGYLYAFFLKKASVRDTLQKFSFPLSLVSRPRPAADGKKRAGHKIKIHRTSRWFLI